MVREATDIKYEYFYLNHDCGWYTPTCYQFKYVTSSALECFKQDLRYAKKEGIPLKGNRSIDILYNMGYEDAIQLDHYRG